MSKMDKLEWWVVLPREGSKFNVFNSVRFRSCLMDIKHRQKREDLNFKEEIRQALSYCFRGKVEYEIVSRELFAEREYKTDVYDQVYQNFNHFIEYLSRNWDKVISKSYKQQLNETKGGGKF